MPLGFPPAATRDLGIRFVPASFSELEGWAGDDHASAFTTFLRSCAPVLNSRAAPGPGGRPPPPEALLTVCEWALEHCNPEPGALEAKAFFEDRFTPHRVVHEGPEGLLTGYYEPLLQGLRSPDDRFRVPVYRRPPDLVNMVAEQERGAVGSRYTHLRQTRNGLEPYATREEIEKGALDGLGLELLWLDDEVDAFFLHIQGSGRIRFADGTTTRITYDGKNGHPYTSIGRHLIDTGQFPADRMSLDALKKWLQEDAERGRQAMWQNRSYVFFRELVGAQAGSALGVLEIPLTEGRSLAVDTGFHWIGTPVFVTAPSLTHAGAGGFRRLMIAQDVGSAIRGPERGDIYFGSGTEAGALAGITKHPGRFTVLLPKGMPL